MDDPGGARGNWWYRRRVKTNFYNLYGVPAPVVFATLVEKVPWRIVARADDVYRATWRFERGTIELLTVQVTDIGDGQAVVRATWHQRGLQWYRVGRTRRRGKWQFEDLVEHSFKQTPRPVDAEWPYAPLPNRATPARWVPHIGYHHPLMPPVACPHCGELVAINTEKGWQVSTCGHCGGSFQHVR